MILIGIGANLPYRDGGSPRETCDEAVAALASQGIEIKAQSRWFESAPVPASDQPWFVNGVVSVATALDPAALLARLHAVEERFGRRRSVPNAARTLDLDLLDYDGLVRDDKADPPVLPHPRLSGRAFVLLPLADIAPDWRHPVTGLDLAALIERVPPEQITRALEPTPESLRPRPGKPAK